MAPDCVGPRGPRGCRPGCATAACCCSRTCASTRRRRRTTPPSRRRWSRTAGAAVFVNDAFGSAHRAHASTEGVSHHVKRSVAGLLMEKELQLPRHGPGSAGAALRGRARRGQGLGQDRGDREPAAAGGRAARRRRHGLHVPPRARGLPTGKSLVEEDKVELARTLLAKGGGKIRLPARPRGGGRVQGGRRAQGAARSSEIPDGWMGLDIGPRHGEGLRRRRPGARSSCSGTAPWACSR